jgi:POT family proton-dependent oligopeptide transporter
MQTTSATDNPINSGEWLGHPKGLFVCFATELWERFSFYGMKYLLLLYLTKYHLFGDEAGLDVLGAYAGLVYTTPVIGGMLADRYLGMRKSVIFGGVLLVLGHLGMAFEGAQAYLDNGTVIRDTGALQVFYFSLALIIVGVGFLKPNISTIVGRLYRENDSRRDAGFTIFYMGINIGSFIATLFCGWLGETYGWRYGFGAAGVGMILGLITFSWGQRYLEGKAEPTDPELLRGKVFAGLSREWLIYIGAIVSLFFVWRLVQFNWLVHDILVGLSFAVLVGLGWFLAKHCTPVERHRMLVLIVLIISSVVFWALFEQSAASMTLFADRVVDRSAFGVEFTASQLGSLNALFIMLVAPFMAWLWVGLGKRGWEPTTPTKFALGILQGGLGFGALVLGTQSPDAAGKVALIWLVLAYFLHTTGELCLSPVGLSAVTKLAVPRVVGVMMGAWFLASAYAELAAAQISKLAAIKTDAGQITDVAAALSTYGELFAKLLWVGLAVGVFMLLLSPLLRKGTHGIH